MSGFDIIRLNALMSGLVIAGGLYAQAIKIHRTKSASDLSAILMIALVYNELSWLTYGFGIGEWPIMALTTFSLPAEVAIIIGYFRYGRRRTAQTVQHGTSLSQ